jgi:hypothetical protein
MQAHKVKEFNARFYQEFKIIQSFVTKKIILSMAGLLYKWLAFFLVTGIMAGHGRHPASILVSPPHPYYISVVEINHNSGEKTLEISVKIFTNDFETTLEKGYKTKVDLASSGDHAAMDRLISDYVRKHLSIKSGGQAINLSYVGFEKEDEAVYSYFQAGNIASVKTIDIFDSILHDFSDQQINIVHCVVGGKRQSTKLDYPKTDAHFSY